MRANLRPLSQGQHSCGCMTLTLFDEDWPFIIFVECPLIYKCRMVTHVCSGSALLAEMPPECYCVLHSASDQEAHDVHLSCYQ